MYIQMDHFELNFEPGKVVQSLKKMAVDGAHHYQSKLNEVAERTTQNEVRQSDNAVDSEADSKRTIAISTFETSPGKAT